MLGLYEARNKEREMQKEITSFDYIDAAVMKRVKPDEEARDTDRKEAKDGSRVIVAGFPVYDPDTEKKMLDKIIAKRNKSITQFIDHRKEVTKKLGDLGVKPLAVVPRKAWADICHQTGLVVMAPDAQGNVTISRSALQRYGSAAKASAAAEKDHAAYVRALFPRTPEGGMAAKVVLPTVPEDVAAILLKARSLSLNLAAVPEAVRFVQTPTELYNSATVNPQDEWARRQGYADYKDWIKRDPIVFHNHGVATAVIAQFGDFPIEKAVVDLVMAGDNLIPDQPEKAATVTMVGGYGGLNDLYSSGLNQAMRDMQIEQQRMIYEARRQMTGTGTLGNAMSGYRTY